MSILTLICAPHFPAGHVEEIAGSRQWGQTRGQRKDPGLLHRAHEVHQSVDRKFKEFATRDCINGKGGSGLLIGEKGNYFCSRIYNSTLRKLIHSLRLQYVPLRKENFQS